MPEEPLDSVDEAWYEKPPNVIKESPASEGTAVPGSLAVPLAFHDKEEAWPINSRDAYWRFAPVRSFARAGWVRIPMAGRATELWLGTWTRETLMAWTFPGTRWSSWATFLETF
jgi:hypothetical protein